MGPNIQQLAFLAIIGIGTSVGMSVYSEYSPNSYYNLGKKSESIAEQKYGDKVAPLTDVEREEWYDDIGVEWHSHLIRAKTREPTKSQLLKFIEENQ